MDKNKYGIYVYSSRNKLGVDDSGIVIILKSASSKENKNTFSRKLPVDSLSIKNSITKSSE